MASTGLMFTTTPLHACLPECQHDIWLIHWGLTQPKTLSKSVCVVKLQLVSEQGWLCINVLPDGSVRGETTRTGEEKNLPQGGYSRAGDNMAKAAGTLKEHGCLPRVVWQTSADTALNYSSHTSFLWLELTGICTETSSLFLMHANNAYRSRSVAVRHDHTLTKNTMPTLERSLLG